MSKKNSIPSITDAQFIEGIYNSSEEMLGKLYKLHFPMILQFILMNNGSEHDAKDIYQETIIILCDKINKGSFELNSKLKTFIYSVSRRLWLKRLNLASRNSGQLHDFEEILFYEEDLQYHENRELHFEAMGMALVRLGEPCKTIIEDFYIHDLSMTEISEKFGYTNSENAKTQKYKCLQRLKKLFFAEYTRGD